MTEIKSVLRHMVNGPTMQSNLCKTATNALRWSSVAAFVTVLPIRSLLFLLAIMYFAQNASKTNRSTKEDVSRVAMTEKAHITTKL